MPPRGRGNKVAKPRGGGRTSPSKAAAKAVQQQLSELAQQAESNSTDDAQAPASSLLAVEDPSSHSEDAGNSSVVGALPLNHQGDEQQPDLQPQPQPVPQPRPQPVQQPRRAVQPRNARTATTAIVESFGDQIKLDSALCKKLADEVVLREPTQRRRNQKLNMERRSNVEALMAQMTGVVAPRPCKNCHKGHGPWNQCIVVDGQMCGSCSNCWFNASGSRCTFHENNNPTANGLYPPTMHMPAPPVIPYQPPAPPAPPSHEQLASMCIDIHEWGVSHPARRLVNQAMGDVASFNRRERYLARIEAAAKELGMRISEYNEYLQTPEGMDEHQRSLEQEDSDGSYAPEPSMEAPTPSELVT